jgi:SEC-C motif-containing protein
MTPTATPSDCLRLRFDAYCCGDFAAVYASYHPQAPFLQYFPDLSSYLTFAREQLAEIELVAWQCTMERRLDAMQAECLQIVEYTHQGAGGRMVELALLTHTNQGWRYHSAQKLDAQDMPDPAILVDFSHFDQAVDKVRF